MMQSTIKLEYHEFVIISKNSKQKSKQKSDVQLNHLKHTGHDSSR